VDEAIRLRIVQTAAELFHAKGYRNVTLSELATRLGMSKKTMYVYFSGKEQIAAAVLDNTMAAIRERIAEHTHLVGDPLQVLGETFRSIKQEIVKLSPLFLDDIQRYMPEQWQKVEVFRAKQLTFIERLLQEAHQAGLTRNLNPKLAAVLISESIQAFIRPDFAAKHGATPHDVAETIFILFIEGIRIKNDQ
jgi:AcrR family transcriptional regulator